MKFFNVYISFWQQLEFKYIYKKKYFKAIFIKKIIIYMYIHFQKKLEVSFTVIWKEIFYWYSYKNIKGL